MTEPIEIKTNSEPVIRLLFDHHDDRWGHRWFLESGATTTELMRSLEGTPDQDWPSSPPLQEVSRHSLDRGDALLCVGMAGKSHWSASFSVEPGSGADAVKSDLACLQKQLDQNAQLGSTYVLNPEISVRSNSKQRVEFELNDQSRVVIEALEDSDFSTRIECSDQVLKIGPQQIGNSPLVATRWGFVLGSPNASSAPPA